MEKEIFIEVTEDLEGKSVGYIISNKLNLSRAIVAKLKNYENGIMLNSVRVRANTTVKTGDELRLNIPEKEGEKLLKFKKELEILYEDEDVILVNKPFDMPTHPSKFNYEKTLANALAYYFKEKSFVFRVITRLDKDTTGVVLVAKNHLSAQKLNENIKKGKIEKEYVAVVKGAFEEKDGEINLPIKKDRGTRHIVAPDGKAAHTIYSVEKGFGDLSLVKLKPLTGRTHQLRVHMSSLGHPMYGDTLYGAKETGERCRLHCRKVEFIHPTNGKRISVEAPIPSDIVKLCCNEE